MIRKRARQCKWLARSLRRRWDKATTLFGDQTDFRKSRGKRWSLELVLTLAFLSMCTCLLSQPRPGPSELERSPDAAVVAGEGDA